MNRIHFPYPLLIFLTVIIWLFLIGNSDLPDVLVTFLIFLAAWFLIITPMGDLFDEKIEEWEDLVYSDWYKTGLNNHRSFRMNYRIWENRMHEDRHFRNKIIAAYLLVILTGTGILAWLEEDVILWRAIMIMVLCAAGLTAVFIDEIIQGKRKNN